MEQTKTAQQQQTPVRAETIETTKTGNIQRQQPKKTHNCTKYVKLTRGTQFIRQSSRGRTLGLRKRTPSIVRPHHCASTVVQYMRLNQQEQLQAAYLRLESIISQETLILRRSRGLKAYCRAASFGKIPRRARNLFGKMPTESCSSIFPDGPFRDWC
jgi:hypothetical protein